MPSNLRQGGWCYVTKALDSGGATVSLHTDFELVIPLTNAGDEDSDGHSSVRVHMTNRDHPGHSVDRHVTTHAGLVPGDTGHAQIAFGAGELVSGLWDILVYGEHDGGGNPDYHGSAIEIVDDRSVEG